MKRILEEADEIFKSLVLLDVVADSENETMTELNAQSTAMRIIAQDVRERVENIYGITNTIQYNENALDAARKEFGASQYHVKVLNARIESALDVLEKAAISAFPGSVATTEKEKKEAEAESVSAGVWISMAMRILRAQQDCLVKMPRREG